MIFTESAAFHKALPAILSEDEYFALQVELIRNPAAGVVIPGAQGLRKLRVASKSKGKRGGARVIYYWYVTPEIIQFARIYEKSSQANLSRAEIKTIITELES